MGKHAFYTYNYMIFNMNKFLYFKYCSVAYSKHVSVLFEHIEINKFISGGHFFMVVYKKFNLNIK